jgi:putative restriction endonuclease
MEIAGTALRCFWWVNHKHAYRQELEGEYLWSPKQNQNKARNQSYENMTRVYPGDVVFSFADAAIRAVGLAVGRAREALQPMEFGRAGKHPGKDPGWELKVRFRELGHPLRPKDHAMDLRPVLPAKYSPIRATGDRNQGVYLVAVPEAMADVLRRLLQGQLEESVEILMRADGRTLADDAAEETIIQRRDIGPTEKARLMKARRGQGIFRENLERVERSCRVTGLLDRRHLRASHIKPWYECNDREKLDGFNGLLLSPHLDHLFDRGYLSFSDSGDLLISRHLNPTVLEFWGLSLPRNVGAFHAEQCKYLDYHRRNVFEQVVGGRRVTVPDEVEAPKIGVHVQPVVVYPAK